MSLKIPEVLAVNCQKAPERVAWLRRLPDVVRELEQRWSLTLQPPFDGEEVSCSYVALAERGDGSPAVLKIGMPHFEGEHEIQGLHFWDGDPTVRLLMADDELNAILLERCEPGTRLNTLPESEQDEVIASLLRRIWRVPEARNKFRPLAELMRYWSEETLADREKWPDVGLVREGLTLFAELSRLAPTDVLLATDLHAGNVLRAQREPWLVIDPKPFVGDQAYDATQHLFNCQPRLKANLRGVIGRFADLLGVDAERIRLWMFARAAAEPREHWENPDWAELARAVAR